ncbi:cysteine dioxygenase family protein [Nonomuraea roseoviolacea subsp. roseoviolacea]|uniref:Metal-dependent enzyme (Double-stranded beta helix superfamily) n=2 Tax=Nonomuraea TaxID=83681 RepID=A0ABT1JVF5_9ACTN|nr:putative metal-dependent enzyme (double-stranded beta helix superfamily) [Nonomuraea roseoviolacea subsp. carminata]
MEMTTTTARPGLSGLVTGIGRIVALGLSPRATAREVATLLRGNLPGVGILTPEERAGVPGGYASHVLHAQADFSVTAVVWQPAAETVIHDHVSWCAFGVISGIEHETLYRDMGDHLVEIGRAANRPGDVSGFAPPGDIHRVRNTSGEVGVSLHVYGADIGKLGNSIRRTYDLPVR